MPEGEGAYRLQHQARSPPQHLRAAHIAPYKCQAGAPALVALPKGTLVEQGRHPPGPCSRDLASATWFPVRLAEGSHGGSGRGTGTPLPEGSCRCIQSLCRLSPCSLLSLLFLLHGCAVRPGHSGGAFKFMHALQPEPETVSNSCMPCCHSLRLSQIHACYAATA